jgi:hypothetical protein
MIEPTCQEFWDPGPQTVGSGVVHLAGRGNLVLAGLSVKIVFRAVRTVASS